MKIFAIDDKVTIVKTGRNSDIEGMTATIIGFYTMETAILLLDTPIRNGQTGLVLSIHCLKLRTNGY